MASGIYSVAHSHGQVLSSPQLEDIAEVNRAVTYAELAGGLEVV